MDRAPHFPSSWPPRYCTEGKRTFSSRLILEKHIQVRHGIKVTDQTRSQEVVIARVGTGGTQVGAATVPGVGGELQQTCTAPAATAGAELPNHGTARLAYVARPHGPHLLWQDTLQPGQEGLKQG